MLNEGIYDKIIITRPVQSLSGDIGYLPGTKYDKMEPWIQPIIDNLKYIFKNAEHYFELMMEKGVIEIEALSYIRGRSLPNTIFILDEAQNITYKEAKAVITRMGENSKLILLGDVEQIDAPHLDSATCGLGAVVEKFRDFRLSAHITLLKGERSPLAAYAAKIL
jgi:PhoH-like ATPase